MQLTFKAVFFKTKKATINVALLDKA